MKKFILALESSCDDTSVALIEDSTVVYEKTITNSDIVEKHGGVVPELVARSHPNSFFKIFEEIQKIYPDWKKRIKRIAYTSEPGFIGSLLVSKIIATTISLDIFDTSEAIALKKIPKMYDKKQLSLLSVNHLDGHCFSAFIEKKQIFPFIATIVSGGHTQIYYLRSFYDKQLVSATRDDSIGEAYDKVGRMLGIEYPWGHNVDELVKDTPETNFHNLPTPLLEDGSFSFSGIKSKISQIIKKMSKDEIEEKKIELLSEFQYATEKAIFKRTIEVANQFDCKTIAIGGGVSANSLLRKLFEELTSEYKVYIPKKIHCVDNATMIGWAAKIAIQNFINIKKDTLETSSQDNKDHNTETDVAPIDNKDS